MEKKLISFEEAKQYLDQVVGLPINRIWNSNGTYLFFELGKLHQIKQVSKDKKNSVITSEGEFSLAIEGYWIYSSSEGNEFNAEKKYASDNQAIDHFTQLLQVKKIQSILFDDESESVLFTFDDNSSMKVLISDAGLLSLYDNVNSAFLEFELEKGQFYRSLVDSDKVDETG